MDLDQETPHAETLRKLPYSELKKVASKYGIKQKLKFDKLIAAILSRKSDADEIFLTPAVKELNSSRMNKEKKLDEVQMTPLATPRRGTYSVETPTSVNKEDLSSVSLAVNASDLDLSNVTVSRGSERKLRPRKVSFMSPAMTPRTPKSQSLRNRPKTPIATRTPLNRSVSSATFSGKNKRKSFGDSFIGSTPQAKAVKFETESDMESSAVLGTINSTPLSCSSQKAKKNIRTPRTELSSQNVKSSTIKDSVKEKTSKKKGMTSRVKNAVVTKEPTSIKRGATPNFRRIHQKAFDKMESIDDYQKRKLLNSAKKITQRPDYKVTKAKSRIPAFGGIPFIPSQSTTTSIKLNSKLMTSVGKRRAAAKENTPQSVKNKIDMKAKTVVKKDTPQPMKSKFDMKNRNVSKRETPQSVKSKSKFDLKASLSRKLSYRPYKGPLKPLSESNSLNAVSFLNVKEPVVNKVVKENRLQTRSVIRGVRINKRFELQMKNRKLD